MLSNKWKSFTSLHLLNQTTHIFASSGHGRIWFPLLTPILFDCFGAESSSTSACLSKSAVHPSKGTDESVVKQSAYSQRQSFGQENGKRQKVTPPILWKIQTNRVTHSLDFKTVLKYIFWHVPHHKQSPFHHGSYVCSKCLVNQHIWLFYMSNKCWI